MRVPVSKLPALLLTGIAGSLLLAMMVLTVADVVGRAFGAPIPGAFEATEIMLALVVFAGLPIVTARREHVAVAIARDRLAVTARRMLERLCEAAVVLLLAGAAVLLWRQAVSLADYGDATVLLRIPLAPVAGALAALTAAAAVAGLVRLVLSLR